MFGPFRQSNSRGRKSLCISEAVKYFAGTNEGLQRYPGVSMVHDNTVHNTTHTQQTGSVVQGTGASLEEVNALTQQHRLCPNISYDYKLALQHPSPTKEASLSYTSLRRGASVPYHEGSSGVDELLELMATWSFISSPCPSKEGVHTKYSHLLQNAIKYVDGSLYISNTLRNISTYLPQLEMLSSQRLTIQVLIDAYECTLDRFKISRESGNKDLYIRDGGEEEYMYELIGSMKLGHDIARSMKNELADCLKHTLRQVSPHAARGTDCACEGLGVHDGMRYLMVCDAVHVGRIYLDTLIAIISDPTVKRILRRMYHCEIKEENHGAVSCYSDDSDHLATILRRNVKHTISYSCMPHYDKLSLSDPHRDVEDNRLYDLLRKQITTSEFLLYGTLATMQYFADAFDLCVEHNLGYTHNRVRYSIAPVTDQWCSMFDSTKYYQRVGVTELVKIINSITCYRFHQQLKDLYVYKRDINPQSTIKSV